MATDEVTMTVTVRHYDWDSLREMLLNYGARLEENRANSEMRTAYHRRAKKRGRR